MNVLGTDDSFPSGLRFSLSLEVPEPWNKPFLSRGTPWATYCVDPGATAPLGFVDALHSIVGNLGARDCDSWEPKETPPPTLPPPPPKK